jgi:LL-diaminopimelate aminotransferase
MRVAKRVEHLPPYLFAELDRKIAERRAAGVDVISLGIGDPDRPTPEHVVAAAQEGVADASTHQYPSYYGMPEFRQAVATWFRGRFGVELDPDTEVLPLLGSKEGLAHLAFAYLDPGDAALVPDPGYPVYATATTLAGAEVVQLPLPASRGFLPDWVAVATPTDRT